MLDKEVIQYTRDGIVKKNLATGKLNLVGESDYAKEWKRGQPGRESRYQSPYDHSERHGPPGDPDLKLDPLSGRKRTCRSDYLPFGYGESNELPKGSSAAWDPSFNQKSDSKKHRNVPHNIQAGKRVSPAATGSNLPGSHNTQRKHTRSIDHTGLRKSDRLFFRFRLLHTIGKEINKGRAVSKQDENLGIQTVGEVYRTMGRIRFGIHSITQMKQWRSRRAAKKAEKLSREKAASRSVQASQAVGTAGGGAAKSSSLLKHTALAKFFLTVAVVLGGMILLSMLLGGTAGSFIGSETEHPELTSYVQQLDTNFISKLNSAIASYEQQGDVVTVEGDTNISTDPGALAILVTKDWTDIELTSENKDKLAQCHAILNYYTVSSYDVTTNNGKSKTVVHHVIILIHACTAEERIDAFEFSEKEKAHVLDMLGTLRQIEAETGTGNAGSGNVSEKVQAYRPLVSQYCAQYGISGYEDLVLAVMQQESGGAGGDPMQASECGYNTKFPHSPNSITDPDYSIQCGVEELASCLRTAKCMSSGDIPNISLALQGYNFGNSFITWAQQRGGYSFANAVAFSEMEAKKEGWTSYGDINYVSHVLRYYNAIQNGGNFIWPVTGHTDISSGYGPRIDPITGKEGAFHSGIDIPAPTGTSIHAAASGTVIYAQYGVQPYGGYGNLVIIRHSASLVTMYGHCSKLLVSAGQTVQQGQAIATVGQTGRATGPHCHFEVRVNGQHTDPMPYLQSKGG